MSSEVTCGERTTATRLFGVVSSWDNVMYLLGLSATAFSIMIMTQGKSASCETSDEGAVPNEHSTDKNSAFRSFLKELHMVLRDEQINVDADDCKDRGKPWNSYHKIDVFPQVSDLRSCHTQGKLLT